MRPESRLLDRLLRLVVMTAAALIPVVFYLKSYEVFNDTKSWTLRAFGMLAGVLLLARGEPIRTKGLPGALALLGAGALSMQHTPLLQASLERMSEFLSFAILMIAAETGALSIRRLLACALWSYALVMTYATAQYFHLDVIGWTEFGPGRVYATMGNPDFLAAHSSIIVPVMAGLLGAVIAADPERSGGASTTKKGAMIFGAATGFIIGVWLTILGLIMMLHDINVTSLMILGGGGLALFASARLFTIGTGTTEDFLQILTSLLRTILIYLGPVCGFAAVCVAVFTVFHPLTEAPDKHFNLLLLGVAGLAFFIAGFMFTVRLRDARNLLVLLLVITVPSLIYTAARGSLLGFLAAVPVFALLGAKTVWGDALGWGSFVRRIWKWFIVVALALAGLTYALPTGRHLIERIQEFSDPVKSSSMQIRLFYWYSGWLMGRGEPTAPDRQGVHWPVGAGIGAFHLAGQRTQGRAQEIWNVKWPQAAEIVSPHLELYAHNDYVHLFAEIGPIGLGIYLWIAVTLLAGGLAGLRRTAEHSPDRWLLIGLLSATVSWYVNSLFNFPLKVVQNAHLFFAVIVPALLSLCPFAVRVIPVRVPGFAVILLGAFVTWRAAAGGIRTMASHYLKFGHQLTQQGGAEVALPMFSRAGKIASVHTDGILIHYYRGKANQAAGRLEEAELDFSRALAIFVNFPEGYQARAMVRYAKAVQLLTGAAPSPGMFAGAPTDTGAATERARQDAAGWLTRAGEDLEASRFLNPKDPTTWYYIGLTRRIAGDAAGVITAFRNVVKFSENHIPDAFYYIALAEVDRHRLADARAALEEGFARFPPNSFPPDALKLRARLAKLAPRARPAPTPAPRPK